MTNKFNQFDIPNLYYFEAGNYFTGSRKKLNFRIDTEGDMMKVITWHGFISSERCTPEVSAEFPITSEGHQHMLDWLEDIYQQKNAPDCSEASTDD